MLQKLRNSLHKWLEKRKNLKRFRKEQDPYEAAIGANQRFIENLLKERRRNEPKRTGTDLRG
jgi:hypothetical protein